MRPLTYSYHRRACRFPALSYLPHHTQLLSSLCTVELTSSTRRRSDSCSLSKTAHLYSSKGRRHTTTAGVFSAGRGRRLPTTRCCGAPASASARGRGKAAADAILPRPQGHARAPHTLPPLIFVPCTYVHVVDNVHVNGGFHS